MRREALGVLLLGGVLLFSGCSISTPHGTVSLSFDKDKTTEQTVFTDSNGNQTVINTQSVSSYVDQLLGTVSLPNGSTVSELRSFVMDGLSQLGIDLDNMDFTSDADVEEVNEAIKGLLEESGVDIDSVDVKEIVGEDK